MLNIAVCISGGGTDLQSVIDACERGEINGAIKLVMSNRKKAYGLTRAKNHGSQAEVIRDEEAILERFAQEKIDLIVLAGYLAIVGEKTIQTYRNRIINIHPSLIPSFCGPGMYGMHVHNAVYKRGVRYSGCTVHFVTEDVDAGPIILQQAVDIYDVKSPEEIQERVLEEEHKILPKAVQLFCDGKLKVVDERVEIEE